MIWIADAHCGDEKRFVVRAEEKLTAFIELESAVRACGKALKYAKLIAPEGGDGPHAETSQTA